MTVYHAFVHKPTAERLGIDMNTPLGLAQLCSPNSLYIAFKDHPDGYAVFHDPSPGNPASEEYKRLDADPAYKKFVISGN